MGQRSREILKSFFEKKDLPTEAQFIDFIDSCLNLTDDPVTGTDERIKISATDLLASYLNSKLVGGTGITFTVLNPGANEQLQISATGGGSGDMLKTTYDADDSGVVDDAELVNGLEVETAVPVGALFTDTVYNDTAIQAEVDSNTTHRSSDGKNHSDVVVNNAKVSNITTNLSLGAITGTTMIIVSSDGTNAILIAATTDDAGLLTAAKFDEIVANTAKISYTDAANVGLNTTHRGVTTGNPHNVNKSDVSLSNVDNTADVDKPVSTATQTALDLKVNNSEVGVNNGIAELDSNGFVPAAQLPSYVDDVLEFVNLAAFPVTGETGKIYVAIDTGLIYRWSGSVYVVISSTLALGETSATAYRGDRGKTAYDHSQLTSGNPHSVVATEISDFDTEVSNNSSVVANTAKDTNVSTDLSLGTVTGTTMIVISSDGTNVTLIAANTTDAGLLTAAKWNEIVANTLKISNATHTGDVTGATVLTIANGAVDIIHLSASGTPSASNFLRGDNTWAVPGGSGDMVLADTQTVTGAKTFENAKLLLRNVADTFNGSFINTNTANRIYTLQNAAGILAFLSDITGTNSGTNTGDQITIVGITGTKAQFDTAVTDGNILYVGDVISNIPTALSIGTITAITFGITSDGGVDDIVLPEANTTQAGLLGAGKWDEIVANNAKVTNVSTDLSEGTSTETTVNVNSSDGNNATLVAASTLRAGLLTKAKFDEIEAKVDKAGETMTGALIASDHGTATTAQIINAVYGTSDTPPTASTTTEGTVYFKYTA